MAELGLDAYAVGEDGAPITTTATAGSGSSSASSSAAVTEAQQGVVYPQGLWEELSNMLNRPPEIVRARVRSLRSKGIALV